MKKYLLLIFIFKHGHPIDLSDEGIIEFYKMIHQKLKKNAEKYLAKAARKSPWRAEINQIHIGDKVSKITF